MTTKSKIGIHKYKLLTITKHPLLIDVGPTELENVTQALRDTQWISTMKFELQALHTNDTWSLVPSPQYVIGNK